MIKIIKNTYQKTTYKALFSIITLLVIFTSSSAQAQATNPVSTVLSDCTKTGVSCGWLEFIKLLNAIIQYGKELIAIVFVLVLLYTGFLYLTSGGDESKVNKVREMLGKIVWGLIWTLCGWIIVYFILTKLGVDATFYNQII